MKQLLLALVGLMFFTPCAFAIQDVSLRVGLISLDGDTLFDSSYYATVRTALEKGVQANYAVEGFFEVITEDRRSYKDAIDRQGEEYMISYLEGRGLDLVLLSEMSTDGQQLVFKCYQKTGLFDDFYLPYSADIDPLLPEITVGTFLGLIERVDGRLFSNRRY